MTLAAASKPPITVLLATPRGFCAGVDRAIQIVERAIEKYGAPVYVRHEIVHNRHVVERLKALGAVFVEELDECPPDRPVVFSAHGVPKAVPAEAKARKMLYLDATCPLVSKVHVEAGRHHDAGREIVLIGHAGHPEGGGHHGPAARRRGDADRDGGRRHGLPAARPGQRGLRHPDDAVGGRHRRDRRRLRARFPEIAAPHKEDICYATTNRQEAVKTVAAKSDVLLVLGSANSTNSVRLAEVGQRSGAASYLIDDADSLDLAWLAGASVVGVTAGASAPEVLVQGLIDRLAESFTVTVEEVDAARETVTFKLPRVLVG